MARHIRATPGVIRIGFPKWARTKSAAPRLDVICPNHATKEWLCAYLDFLMEGFWLEYFLVLSNVDQRQASAIKTEKYEVYRCKKRGNCKSMAVIYCVKESLDALVFLKKNQRKN